MSYPLTAPNIVDYNEEVFPKTEEFKPSRRNRAHEDDMGMFSFRDRGCEYYRSTSEQYKPTLCSLWNSRDAFKGACLRFGQLCMDFIYFGRKFRQ